MAVAPEKKPDHTGCMVTLAILFGYAALRVSGVIA